MATHDQLEIVYPSGEIEFHDLDPATGVTNIGRHPDNDVVIDGPGVAPFQAMVDHRQQPYRIMVLSEECEATVEGERLLPNTFRELHNWDTVQIDSYAIILLEAAPAPAGVEAPRPPLPEPLPRGVAEPSVPPVVPAAPIAPSVPGVLAPDRADELIVVELSATEWTIDVEQTAACQVTIVNGGNIVATFDIAVEGLPVLADTASGAVLRRPGEASWVSITSPRVNLYEGGRATVNILIEPPRLSTSTAGPHPFSVVVTSPNYPGHASRSGATLIINPYYEFAVGALSPVQQSVSWHRRSGRASLPIANRGNGVTSFRVDGEDDERGLRFEFRVPGEEASLVKQAELRLGPDESYAVPIQITPNRRRLVALRSRQYAFTITASMLQGLQTPRSVMGRLKARPLIGPLPLLLMFVGLVTLILFLFRPIAEPGLSIDNAAPLHEQAVTLTYDAKRFPDAGPNNLLNRLNGLFLNLSLEFKGETGDWQVLKSSSELAVEGGSVTDIPLANGRYRLTANNLISNILPMFQGVSREVAVYVTPVEPVIEEFRVDRNPIFAGQEVTLFWKVAGAETLKLVYNGIEESLQDQELQSGQRKFSPEINTTYTLVAGNSSWPSEVQKPLEIVVLVPTATPIPTPVIVQFDVEPMEITAGGTVNIDWEVTGADSVSINPLNQPGLPIKGTMSDQPANLTTYQLIAIVTGPDGTQVKNSSLLKEVIVNPLPSATPEPVAPEVQIFEITPKEIIRGITNTVKLTWAVSGKTTDIQLTGPDLKIGGLKEQDTMTVTVKDTALMVLTAFNGDLSRSASAEVTVLEPTPTSTATPVPTEPPPPPPTETPVPTATPIPKPVISYFKAEGQEGYESKVSFQASTNTESGPLYVYSVEAGSWIRLSWEAKAADVVTVEGYGPQPAVGDLPIPEPVTRPSQYMLVAENGGGKVSAFIQIDLEQPPAPEPPYGVVGQEDPISGTNTINWSYPNQARAKIDGFRIYRAQMPPGTDFVPVFALYDPNAFQWQDKLKPGETCGKAYFVVAIYTDLITGNEEETAASDTSWYSAPCP
jgi:hypothetical protein